VVNGAKNDEYHPLQKLCIVAGLLQVCMWCLLACELPATGSNMVTGSDIVTDPLKLLF